MRKTAKFIILLLMVIVTASGCVATKRNAIIKRVTASTCEAAKMGRNKLFYSKHYKRVHGLETRKIRHRY
jgi:hypothetical protein